MSQAVGTWVYGDEGRELHYTVTQSGSPFDVAGASNITLTMVKLASGVDTVVTKSGAILGASTNGTFEFEQIGITVASPTSRLTPDVYECRVSFEIATLTYFTDPFRIHVVKFP